MKPKLTKKLIYLTDEQDRLLRHLAIERKISFSALMQEAAEKLLAEARARGEIREYETT